MLHDLIVSPFLDGYLALRPGSAAGARLPEAGYEELRALVGNDSPAPSWFAETVAQVWGLDLVGKPVSKAVLVRERSSYGFSKASWEINLGCNFACTHCYLGMMLTVSTNASRLWEKSLLAMFEECPAYRLVVSVYGATEESVDRLTQRRGAWKAFKRGMDAAREAHLPVRLNIIVTNDNAHETDAMVALAEKWGLKHHVFSNMTPTIYGGPESLLAQSSNHLRERSAFTGCNAGVTFFHADPHAKVSICKVGRDDQIDLMAEGLEGLRRLPAISDALMLRTGGCEGCQLSGTCKVCRPLAKQFQETKAPLMVHA
ncbi:radical SAM protein [Streptomyces sp. CBMA29]|uniref:radical SAM protein n=1 Tax=Streptomyces sp. CBMA29 TaxID=1896314 RepID=UPI001661BB85|nr:radical SAM protein [Streptomyces sp. CBMA29]MBD0736959.1 radical SAM protein [Streptomyces sp. CBMA29]